MTRIGLAIAGLGMAAVLTACGGDDFTDQSGEEIADASKAAMKDLDSVKVSGSVSTDGAETRIDVQADADGNCTGSIGVGDGTAELLGVDGDLWFKPDETLWRDKGGADADQIIAAVGDKWVVAPEGQDGFDQFCDVSDLMDEMLKDDGDESTYTKGDTQDVDGDQAIAVDNKDSKGTSTGYILVDDPHYLVKIEKTEGDDTGTVTFSEFNADVDVEAPADDEIIDLSTLAG
jgi:hypothetical protein